MQMSERRPLFPTPDFADKERYRYFSQGEVTSALEKFGFGPSVRRVDAFYLSPDGKTFVGVLRIDEDLCGEHLIGNPIFQGVQGPEAMAQTWILGKIFTGQFNPETQSVRFEELERIKFRYSIYPEVDINIVVRELPEEANTAYGQILSGKRVMIDGVFRGVIVEKEKASERAEKRKRMQATNPPLFPLQD